MNPTPDLPPMSGMTLRPYQVEALDAVAAAQRSGRTRMLITLPTGSGKTVVFGELARRRAGRTLILAHRDELIRQAVDKVRMVNPAADIGVVKAERDEVAASVVVASVQTLAQPHRLARLPVPFDTVVVDEAHHAAAVSYRRIIAHAAGDLVVGFTATPERADEAALDEVFDEVVFEKSLPELIAGGYLVDLRAVQVHIAADLDGVKVRGGDLADADSGRELMRAGGPEVVARAWCDHAGERKGVVFTPTVAMAAATAAALVESGVAAEAVDGTTSPDVRRDILHRLHTGETSVVVNCGVLVEGFDEPSIGCVVIARPTRSRGLYMQMIGRATRLYPGKDHALVLDLVGVTSRHHLVTLASLAGITDAEQLETVGVTEALSRRQVGIAEPGTWAAELVAHEVDLFRKRPMAWVRSGECYALAAGNGYVVLEPSNSTWSVVHRPRSGAARRVATALPLEWAQGTGEDLVRSMGARGLADRAAPWRRRPASDKQITLLRKLRVRPASGVTAGEASDLIAQHMTASAS